MLNDIMVRAIYQMLFHSLWQGAICAAVAGIIILATRKSAPALRYNLLLLNLACFTAAAIFTLISEFGSAAPSSMNNNIVNIRARSIDTIGLNNFAEIITEWAAWFNSHANYIVIGWGIVICFKSIQFYSGLRTIRLIKKYQTLSAGEEWDRQLKLLADQLGINKTVRLLQSKLVRVPQTAGFLKPVIFIPIGLITAIPADQLEAILVHELAHIRRNDYLVNILQSMVEILFFFNPAIWWLSYLLRSERENCCDDIVISRGNSKLDYLKALVSFQEMQYSIKGHATAITGMPDSLLNRARRIISNRNKTLHTMEKTILATTLLITGLIAVSFREIAPKKDPAMHFGTDNNNKPIMELNYSHLFTDTVPENKTDLESQKEEQDEINESADKEMSEKDSRKLKKMKEDFKNEHAEEISRVKAQAKEIAAQANKAARDFEKYTNKDKSFNEQAQKFQIQMEKAAEQMKLLFSEKMNPAIQAMIDGQMHSPEFEKKMELLNKQMETMNLKMELAKDLDLKAQNLQLPKDFIDNDKLKAQVEELKKQVEKIKIDYEEKLKNYKANPKD